VGRNDPKLEHWQKMVIANNKELEQGESRCSYCGEIISFSDIQCNGCKRSLMFETQIRKESL